MSNVETIAETIIWEAERRISDEGKSYANLASAIYSVNIEVGLELNKKLKEVNPKLNRQSSKKEP